MIPGGTYKPPRLCTGSDRYTEDTYLFRRTVLQLVSRSSGLRPHSVSPERMRTSLPPFSADYYHLWTVAYRLTAAYHTHCNPYHDPQLAWCRDGTPFSRLPGAYPLETAVPASSIPPVFAPSSLSLHLPPLPALSDSACFSSFKIAHH